MKKTETVLVVENDEVGDVYREAINRILDVNVVWVKNKQDALRETRQALDLRVVVLDQRLEASELGTEIAKEILKINPLVKIIVFSGQARLEDVGPLWNKGLIFRYVKKTDAQELPGIVVEAFAAYGIDYLKTQITERNKLLFSFSTGLNWFRRHRVYLVSQYSNGLVQRDSWQDSLTIDVGQEIAREHHIKLGRATKYEQSKLNELGLRYKGKLDQLTHSLETAGAIKGSTSQLVANTADVMEAQTESMKLSWHDMPSTLVEDALTISYQTSQLYEEQVNIIAVECPECQRIELHTFTTWEPTATVSRKQVIIYKDGTRKETDLGTMTL